MSSVAAVIALIVGIAALLTYRDLPVRDGVLSMAERSLGSQPSNETALPHAGVETTALPKPSSTPADGLAASVLEFAWPGGDCWDIFRGPELVTYGCGAGKQALAAGRYTVKAKNAPVFMPFNVNITSSAPTRISLGGVFEFVWPGGDCWDIFRGPELVTYGCGAGKQALAAGRYTVKAKNAPVFMPFEIKIVDGTEVVKAP
jgi:hypothetical protein